jgi:hemerythrin-like domain-containing protein
MKTDNWSNRRNFLKTIATGGVGAMMASSRTSMAELSEKAAEESHEITPSEDLMFEHGVIERLLLVYNKAVSQIESGQGVLPKLIYKAADIIQRFSENYHEKNEEQHVFPILEQAGQHVKLVKTLRKQHDLGREVTNKILDMTKKGKIETKQLASAMKSYTVMYIPHISRENSVVFRTFCKLLPEGEYIELGERLEQKEREQLGKEGFDGALNEIYSIEIELGIHDLTKFNPAVRTENNTSQHHQET